jgi:hypothetical protein
MERRHLAHVDRKRPADSTDSNRLIRLIDELRALDLERRKQPFLSAAFNELAQRMEAKAREVFEESATRPPPLLDGEPESRSRAPN